MPRPSNARDSLLGLYTSGARASSLTVAERLGVSKTKAREMCQNAKRAGYLNPVGKERVEGSDRPAVVYERVQPGDLNSGARGWHDVLAMTMR